ncbi:MAG: 4'-phosphopantetheinyl transferase superfamily protein [Pseudomonadota bacterium]
MATVRDLDDHEVEIWLASVDQFSRANNSILQPEEIAKARRFAFERDRGRYLATRVFVRQILTRYAETAPAAWRFKLNDHDRPFIDAPAPSAPLFFNLSHAGDYLVCSVARTERVGVDIENHVPDEPLDIAERFFSAKERAWLATVGGKAELARRFLTLWTLKESYIKALSVGLSHPLNAFSLLPTVNNQAKLEIHVESDIAADPWTCRSLVAPADYAMAVSVAHPKEHLPTITQLKFEPDR